jgi:adenosylhomocysteine nucleosidase
MAAAAVTGLAAEARIARRAGLAAAASGGRAARTRAVIAQLIADGATALVSFGICGGLDPALPPGCLLLPAAVRDEAGQRWVVDRPWHARIAATLAARGIAARQGDLLGADAIAASPERKAALRRESGAIAADLESHHVARAAAESGLPFLVLRAIADPAERALPPAALIELGASGRPALAAVLLSLARHPAQLPALLRVASDTRQALRALDRGAVALTAAR